MLPYRLSVASFSFFSHNASLLILESHIGGCQDPGYESGGPRGQDQENPGRAVEGGEDDSGFYQHVEGSQGCPEAPGPISAGGLTETGAENQPFLVFKHANCSPPRSLGCKRPSSTCNMSPMPRERVPRPPRALRFFFFSFLFFFFFLKVD